MSTKIEWTDATWSPVTGCTKVSPGCDHCYAERITNRFGGPGAFDTVTLHPDRLDAPLRWRKPRRVFVNSMSDLFHDDVPDEFIAKVWQVMAATPQHTYQVLTKRHARMRAWFRRWPNAVLTNLWLGVSVEDQRWADIRIPALLNTPAVVRFLSCEPLLDSVELGWYLYPTHCPHNCGCHLPTDPDRRDCACDGPCCMDPDWPYDSGIHWVIVGGESGPGARPMELDYARWLVEQCQAADVPVFVKQLGTHWAARVGADAKGGDMSRWPEDLRIREYPEVAR